MAITDPVAPGPTVPDPAAAGAGRPGTRSQPDPFPPVEPAPGPLTEPEPM